MIESIPDEDLPSVSLPRKGPAAEGAEEASRGGDAAREENS
jgi:hypothetical protein